MKIWLVMPLVLLLLALGLPGVLPAPPAAKAASIFWSECCLQGWSLGCCAMAYLEWVFDHWILGAG
jgi:hypothetical protein